MLLFLRHLGPQRCDELRFLHLEDLLTPQLAFGQQDLNRMRSQGIYTEMEIANFATKHRDALHSDAMEAVKLLNKRGNIQKIFLDMRPSQTLAYIKLFCTQIPGLQNSEIVFASPTRWTVVVQPPVWKQKPWYLTFLGSFSGGSYRDRRFYAYWGGNEKYRVQVEIIQASPEGRTANTNYDRSGNGGTGDNSSVHAAMEDLSLS